MNYIFAAAGGIILFFCFLILKSKKKSIADFLLIAINLFIGCFMLADVLVRRELTSGAVIFQNVVPLFIFPTFVLYVLQFTKGKGQYSKLWYTILAPAFSLLTLSIVDHYILNNYPTSSDVAAHFETPSIWYQAHFKGSQLLFIGILIYLIKELRSFEQKLKDGYSYIETIDVKWLQRFAYIYLGSISLTFVLFLLQNLHILPFDVSQVFGIVYGILVLSVFYLNYEGIQHYTLAQIDRTEVKNEVIKDVKRQQEEPLLSTKEHELEASILNAIEMKKLYLEPKFSLNDLAEEMDESKHTISKVINSKAGRSFYDMVNGYRVQHLKNLMDDPKNDQYTILALGLESGFNSKASLNRIFKSSEGLTPREYLNQRSQSTI